MYGTEVMLVMLLLRLVVPVGLLLWVGETIRRRQLVDFNRAAGQA